MPVLTAEGAGVRHRRRWLFQDLDVSVEPGEIVAVVGPPGSGRTTVLLALARRFKLSAGRVTGSASLGWVPDVTAPEPVLTVLENVQERLLLTGRSPRSAGRVPLLGLDPGTKGYELSPFQRQLLGLVLARLEEPRVIALDGVDEGLDEHESRELWSVLGAIAEDGIAVLVTARTVNAAQVSTVVRLGGSPPAKPAPEVAVAEPEAGPESQAQPEPAVEVEGHAPVPEQTPPGESDTQQGEKS